MTELSPEEWGSRYRDMRPTCEAMTGRLRALVVDLLAEANVEVIQIEARTKEVASFTEKISRKRAKYANPLREITDLVGLRIITYYLEDVAVVGEILKNEFQIGAKSYAPTGPEREVRSALGRLPSAEVGGCRGPFTPLG